MVAPAGDHNPAVNFGRYQLRGRLGEGAAGAVYRAFDPELGREVALKLLHEVDELKGKRFTREAEVTANLAHPGILKVHTFGVLGKVPFLVYELVEGAQTFDEACEGLDERGRVELVRQAAAAIGFAHDQGVVHRDLKPTNLLVDAAGRLRVADFGVATGQDLERLTVTGVWVGTPLYMAPEQLYCERERFGPHTDVWALGAMLYEALTGELPFDAATPMELLSVARAGVRPPRSLKPELPLALEQICLRALESEPSSRYATGGDLARALQGYLEEGKGEAQPRSAAWAAAMILLLLAAIGGLVATGELGSAPANSPGGTPSPNPTPAESSTPTPDLAALERERSDELERALAVEDERRRLALVTAWCRANPEHPRVRRAQRARDELCWSYPLLAGRVLPSERVGPVGVLTGSSFLVLQAANSTHRARQIRRVKLPTHPQTPTEPPTEPLIEELQGSDPRGLCALPGGGYAILYPKGLLLSERGEPPTLIPSEVFPPGKAVKLSAQPAAEGGVWIAMASQEGQVVVGVASGVLFFSQPLSGWPAQGHLRGVLLTPNREVLLFGTRSGGSGVDSGIALRCDAKTGKVLGDLVSPQEVNAVFSATYDPSDPSRLVIGTRFGRVLIFGPGPRRQLVSRTATQLGVGPRAHACAVRYVGYWRRDRILTVAGDPDISGVVKIWDATSGLEQDRIELQWKLKSAHADERHLLLLGATDARVYQLD